MKIAGERDQNSFLFGGNAAFMAELYARYLEDPAAVDASWSGFFASMNDDARAVFEEVRGASWARDRTRIIGEPDKSANGASGANGKADGITLAAPAPASAAETRKATIDSVRALMLIRAYRVRGHLAADLDPLRLEASRQHPELDPATYGFTPEDYDRPIFIDHVLGREQASLREILELLRATYCGTVGVEFVHIQDGNQKSWLQEKMESGAWRVALGGEDKKALYERVAAAEGFEKFLDKKYTGTKRFGLDGGESLIPALDHILEHGCALGLREVVIGMAHRGRLNVLSNVMAKPVVAIFSEFQGNAANPEDVQGSGDVKYHLGTSSDRVFASGTVHLSLTANPSHLEAVDPVAVGKVRAKQRQRLDTESTQVLAVLLHGDAAFAGQGLVAETLALSELRGYRTGGSVHVIINNQIGFTTAPSYSRFTPYCSDLALAVQAPIFHVNADDPEAVIQVARLAIEFRMIFKRDVVIDLVCYRRYGHNEGDEPAFTQPLMYRHINTHPTTRALYAEKLVREGVMSVPESEAVVNRFMAHMEQEFEAAASYRPNKADWLEGKWSGLQVASGEDRRGETAISETLLREVCAGLARYPEAFDVNRKIVRQLEAKRQMLESGEGFDWATAEALAIGSLLVEGVPVRLSGQDSGRGTFSQRHSVLVDQAQEARYVPLNNLRPDQASFEVIDSPLAEASVLGFEYGYSLAEPHALVIWEAQFGDFANGAQVIIDQFISSGESKWLRMSGLVMLLPHGYEGQGPEHSSARLERFLQLCAEDNMQVVNCTTPANYFHALRRQVKREFRKPLIVMTPKSMLRLKAAQSPLFEFTEGSSFHRVLYDPSKALVADEAIRRVVLCSGKLFYDLAAERDQQGIKDILILRLEQLYPFPANVLAVEMRKYPNADVVWAQEEPENMGAWQFLDRRLEQVLLKIEHKVTRVRYAGRVAAASPASGLLRRHNKEQAALVAAALSIA